MNRILVSAISAAAVIAGLTACGTAAASAPSAGSADLPACQILAGAVAADSYNMSIAPGPGTSYITTDAAVARLGYSAPSDAQGNSIGTFSPSFATDLYAVIGYLPASVSWRSVSDGQAWIPSQAQVAVLQADCAALGVSDPIWPANYTG